MGHAPSVDVASWLAVLHWASLGISSPIMPTACPRLTQKEYWSRHYLYGVVNYALMLFYGQPALETPCLPPTNVARLAVQPRCSFALSVPVCVEVDEHFANNAVVILTRYNITMCYIVQYAMPFASTWSNAFALNFMLDLDCTE